MISVPSDRYRTHIYVLDAYHGVSSELPVGRTSSDIEDIGQSVLGHEKGCFCDIPNLEL